MTYQSRTGLILLGALVAYACGGGSDDGEGSGGSATVTPASLSRLSDIEAGEICEAGGTMIETGSDENHDGSLSDSEVTGSVNVCNGTGTAGMDGSSGTDGMNGMNGGSGDAGADAPALLSSTSAADLGTCPAGGLVVEFGGDDDGSGTLEAGEVDSTTTVCSGVPGGDSCAPVTKLTSIAPGALCAAGGIMVEAGPDSGEMGAGGAGGAGNAMACDGVLDESETMTTDVICSGVNGSNGSDGAPGNNGTNGDPGTNGTSMAVRLTVLAAGDATCTNGGLLLESGVDDNDNGVLENGEVDTPTYSCF